jgi:hypothetical protein
MWARSSILGGGGDTNLRRLIYRPSVPRVGVDPCPALLGGSQPDVSGRWFIRRGLVGAFRERCLNGAYARAVTADNGALQQQMIEAALRAATALMTNDRPLYVETINEVSREVGSHPAGPFVYIYQSAHLVQLALGIAAMASGKPIGEVTRALAQAVAGTDWTDETFGP